MNLFDIDRMAVLTYPDGRESITQPCLVYLLEGLPAGNCRRVTSYGEDVVRGSLDENLALLATAWGSGAVVGLKRLDKKDGFPLAIGPYCVGQIDDVLKSGPGDADPPPDTSLLRAAGQIVRLADGPAQWEVKGKARFVWGVLKSKIEAKITTGSTPSL